MKQLLSRWGVNIQQIFDTISDLSWFLQYTIDFYFS